MSSNRVLRVRSTPDGVPDDELATGIAKIQDELEVSPSFPAEVDRAAAEAAAAPRLPDLDRTDLPFVTIDPPSAMDLDQALHIERAGDGFTVHYAIADVAAFVEPGGPIDAEAHRRGETLYGADSKVPLHPKALSEDAASLLPDQVRPAIVWTMTVDSGGEGTAVTVERAMVRSRAKLSYDDAQAALDAGTADESLVLLREVGTLRIEREAARGGMSLPLPEQELVAERGEWRLEFREMLPVEEWNAQISLLTGMAAASLMVEAKVGVLRTLPPADPRDVARLRRTAKARGVAWPADRDHAEFVRTLDVSQASHAAMAVAATRLLRGSGYAAFDGEVPEQSEHSALASQYSHVTAPLRRLVDRYALETCVALSAGQPVPEWVTARFDELADTMRESGRRANQYENAVVDLCEAEVLKTRVGESFPAVVVDGDEKDPTRGSVTIQDPAVEARVTADQPLPVGEDVTVELVQADPASRSVEFRLA